MICHGQGDPRTPPELSGCCFLDDGSICPLRWYVTGGRVYEGPGLVDRGTVTQAVNGRWSNSQARSRVSAQTTGARMLCRAALDAIGASAQNVSDRAKLNAAWNTNPDYVALVRPAWARIEAREGMAAGSYQCSTWKGTGRGQCCWGEDAGTNAARAAALSATAVSVRTAGDTTGVVVQTAVV